MPLDYRPTLILPDDFDRATLAGGDWVNTDSVKLSNLQDRRIKKVARTTDLLTTSTKFTIDFLKDVTLNVMAFANVNWDDDVQIQITGDANPANLEGAAGRDTGQVSPWATGARPTDMGLTRFDAFVQFQDYAARYWEVRLSNPTNAYGYLQMGRAYPGKAIQLSAGSSFGTEGPTPMPADIQQATPFGGTLMEDRLKPREGTLPYNDVDEIDAQQFYELMRLRGNAKDFFVITDPTATTDLHRKMLAAVNKARNPIQRPYNDGYNFRIEYRELLT